MITIRAFESDDWPATWQIIEPVFRAGETYPFAQDISEEEARRIWIERPAATFVAEDNDGLVLGTYFLKPNHPGLGSHVSNCGYIVAEEARGRGIASRMCEHSQERALALGFVAMQYNLVVSTNTGALRLWQRHGFEIVGTLPKAFNHAKQGLTDAVVMYKLLS